MSDSRLSALDASFLAVETPNAHMHLGWLAIFSPPADRAMPRFSQLREHIERRLGRAPRYRQKLAPIPLGLSAPEWVDDPAFSVDRHVYRAPGPVGELADEVLSIPLRRDRPLWEIWICEDAESRALAVVGKVHRCMLDGLDAVELGTLLLDSSSRPPLDAPEPWHAKRAPSAEALLVRGLRDLVGEQLGLLRWPVRAASSPLGTARQTLAGALRVTRALGNSLRPAPDSTINGQLSPRRQLLWTEHPLEDLRVVERTFETTLDDVMLAAVAGAMRAYLLRRGEEPVALKAMVPVSLRGAGRGPGNRLSFIFADLPCDRPDPLARLHRIHDTMSRRRRAGEPEGADLALKAAALAPPILQQSLSRLVASPRTFNLVVSSIPGPAEQLYMLGCPLEAAYPIVPLADGHTLSIAMTSVCELACFGVYADRERLPDADGLPGDLDDAIAELLARARRPTRPRRLHAVEP